MLIEAADAGLLRLAELKTKGKTQLPNRSITLMRPGEEEKRPQNVVSIAEFAQMTKGGDDLDG